MTDLKNLRNQSKVPRIPLFEKIDCVDFESIPFEGQTEGFEHIQNQPLLKALQGSTQTTKPLTVGVVFSGGQAPGGHNVVCGLHEGLTQLHAESKLLGFLNGPQGILDQRYMELNSSILKEVFNTGGFDLLGSGRTKIESDAQFEQALKAASDLKLDGIVIIGGDDSNTNAALLANYFASKGQKTTVVGVPKTIDGDLQHPYIEISFGFDTATKVYSELIGNILKDALSAKKYFHFIRLMGRSASHIALECALQTHPNAVLIGEEIFAKKTTLHEIAMHLAKMIIRRSEAGLNYGCVLIPEGLIEFIPQCKVLIEELNTLLASQAPEEAVLNLTPESKEAYDSLSEEIQKQLLLTRDPHGNVQVSHIETERLIVGSVKKCLEEEGFQGSFNPLSHFFGYEGRASFPTLFDSAYCYNLGLLASTLVSHQKTGYICGMKNLTSEVTKWEPYGVPIASMTHLEKRKGVLKPVIEKALVDLDKEAFAKLQNVRDSWELKDHYCNPGPIQLLDPSLLEAPKIIQ